MFTFRVTTHKNGKLLDMYDSVDYPTREKAIQAARWSAEYYTLASGGEWQKTEDGAIRWWTDEEGNRCRRIYKVNNNQ